MWSSFKDVSGTYHEWKHWLDDEACQIAGIGCKGSKVSNGTQADTTNQPVTSVSSTVWETSSASPQSTPASSNDNDIATESISTSISSYYETSPDVWSLSTEYSPVATPTTTPESQAISSSSLISASVTSAVSTAIQSSSQVTKPPGAHVDHNMHQVLILFGVGLGIGGLFYLLFCVELRVFQFVRNVFKLMFEHNSFENDSEMGLNSESFSTDGNVQRADTRSGLSRRAKLRVLWYMFVYGESFDEARLRYVQYKFASNGISSDGSPLDPKFVRYD